MGTLKGLIFCALLITVNMAIAESTVYASEDTALKFSQCLIEKMSESPFFTVDDRNSMIAVQDVMSQALNDKEHILISPKILLTAFITSLADIILNTDVSKTSYRKETYFLALQQCSIWSTGYADAEFIAEARKILSVFESSKVVKYEETGAFSGVGTPIAGTFSSSSFSQSSNVGSPIIVQPSPVQNQQAPQNFYSNDKTVFGQQENRNTPPIASSAMGAFSSQYAIQPSSQIDIASSFGTGMQAQPGNLAQTYNFQSISQAGDFSPNFVSSSEYQNFPVGFDESGISQSQKENLGPYPRNFPNDYDSVSQPEAGGREAPQFEKDFLDHQSGSFSFDYDTGKIPETADVLSYVEFPRTTPINTADISQTSSEGLNVPQTKESSVIVIPSKTNQEFISGGNLPQNRQQEAKEVIYMPLNQETVAQSELSEFSMTAPADINQEKKQYSDVTSSLTLESIVFNVLINSQKFRETFTSEISQENAINLARDLTERTFAAYDSNIMNDALSVVTQEVLKVRVPSPNTFAFALSRAIVDAVKSHDTSADPSLVATSFIFNLNNPRQFSSQQEPIENYPTDYNADVFSMTSPAAVSQEQQQYSDVTSYPTLESIIFNILKNSPKFRETFNSEISQENAINLARDLTERTFAGYDSNIINDALSVVTQEVLKVQAPYPEPFAFAISNALGYILKRYDSSLSAEQSQVATSFLSNLDNAGQLHSKQDTVQKQPQDYSRDETSKQFYPQSETVEKQAQDYDTSESDFYEFGEKQTDFDFQSPPLSPEDRKDEIFSLSLSQCLTQSKEIRNFFCNGNNLEDRVQLSFSIIKASLIDYGQQVATLAASVASGALSELSKEGLCSNYAKTISEIVAEILEENGIDNAKAEDIARKMEVDLFQRQITPTEPPIPAIIPYDVPPKVNKNETYASEPKLDSSFEHIGEIKTQNPNLVTSSYSKSAFGYEFTYPETLSQTSMVSSTMRPNINSEEWVSDGVKDQKTFGDYLFEHFHTLATLFSEESDENSSKDTTETIEYHESEEEFTGESFVDEFSQTGNQKKKTISTPESDIFPVSSDKSEDDEYYSPTVVEDKDKLSYYQDGDENPQKDMRYSSESTIKTSRVELQPSFQSPAFNSDGTTAIFQKNSGVTSYASDQTDTSVIFARQVSEKAESIIAFIRSPNFNLGDLCTQMNQLAPLVNIKELHRCEPTAAVDYLLNVLRAVIKTLSGV